MLNPSKWISWAQRLAPKLGVQTTESLLKSSLDPFGSTLELGCGRQSTVLKVLRAGAYTGVDGFAPYLTLIETSQGMAKREQGLKVEFIHSDFFQLELAPKSFDQVVLIDVVEHLAKEDGHRLLELAESLASLRVIVKTPNGFVAQDAMDDNHYQEHLSGWTVSDFRSMGFKVFGLSGAKQLRRDVHHEMWSEDLSLSMRFRPRKLWLGAAAISQVYTYRQPEQSFELFATKEL
jgi:2-polyprenyl-3-methyl-5-hydroxy-6-metoxy-1,4-benzoquinol methylase